MHTGSDLFLAEALVPDDLELRQLVAFSWVDGIGDTQFIGGNCGLLLADLGIEVAAPLHVVEQITAPFVEQVIVERVFFVHGNALLELGTADLEALRGNINFRSGLDFEGIIDGIGFRTIGSA